MRRIKVSNQKLFDDSEFFHTNLLTKFQVFEKKNCLSFYDKRTAFMAQSCRCHFSLKKKSGKFCRVSQFFGLQKSHTGDKYI